ncbi:efflux RND transporter permease subunit [Pseudomonas moorei]|uniref:efflux RND transporter permease subunit n=1 Tax=Pseudomonas moorei TaxID=395599 RepID=UPI001FF33DF1|nr:MMPL family transporter [Pseudomonas moorei]
MHRKFGYLERWFEPLLFGHRALVLVLFGLVSAGLLIAALSLHLDVSFQKMVPSHHPYIANYLRYENELRPLGNVVRIAVEAKQGDIYTREFQETLKKVTDEVFFIPGVDRGNMKSLWTPNVMWQEVTEDGFAVGRIIPDGFDGSDQTLRQVRTNVQRSGLIGSLVAGDLKSTIVLVPLLENDPQTGEKLDYGKFSEHLEQLIRDKYSSDQIGIHITGFAKIAGDLIEGARSIAIFFAITFLLTTLLLLAYSRCWRSTAATLLCCSLAVIWQMGIVSLLGYGLNPYSILVPFLTFAIGVSHAVQNINTMSADCAVGFSREEAAKRTFRLLFIPGSIALLCDAVGFSTMMVIDIGMIRELAISASIGVLVIIFTKMFLLPVMMSLFGVSKANQQHQRKKMTSRHRFARFFARTVEPLPAFLTLLVLALVFAGAWYMRLDLKIGDLDRGAPELRVDSRYNKDNDFISSRYSTSSDVFVVMVRTKPGECGSYAVSSAVERLKWTLESSPGVESTHALSNEMMKFVAGSNGGDLRWYALSRNRYVANSAFKAIPSELYNSDCSMVPVIAYLADHKAETLSRVVDIVERFAAENDSSDITFLAAAGNAGIEAATNIVIKSAEPLMLVLVYGIVALLVWWEFSSWRVALCIMIPLYVTSVLCEAIMAQLGLGVKVATLPVIALGVGIGVDYGIYIYNRIENFMAEGHSFQVAYFETLKTTGAAVMLTGITLALGVATWLFSDIKFQADMGLLLMFMFIWNMFGAILMMPALARFLVVPALKPGRWSPAV